MKVSYKELFFATLFITYALIALVVFTIPQAEIVSAGYGCSDPNGTGWLDGYWCPIESNLSKQLACDILSPNGCMMLCVEKCHAFMNECGWEYDEWSECRLGCYHGITAACTSAGN